MLQEISMNMTKELTTLTTSTMKFKVFAPPEWKHSVWTFKFSADEDQGGCSDSVWIGGSILSSLTDVKSSTLIAHVASISRFERVCFVAFRRSSARTLPRWLPLALHMLWFKKCFFFDRGNFRQGGTPTRLQTKASFLSVPNASVTRRYCPSRGFIGKEGSGTRVCSSRCRCGRESAQMFCAHICRTSRWLSGLRVH